MFTVTKGFRPSVRGTAILTRMALVAGYLTCIVGSGVDAQSQRAAFSVIPANAGRGEGLAVGDVNRDGKADVIIADFASHTVSTLLGDGAGHFLVRVLAPTGANPGALAIGDFDHDGAPDLAMTTLPTTGVPGTVRIYRGNGSGDFVLSSETTVGNATSLAVMDIDRDGNLDILLSVYIDGKTLVMYGNGLSGFTSPAEIDCGASPYAAAAGDLNRDGLIDIVASNYVIGASTVSVALGSSARSFGKPIAYQSGPSSAGMIVTDLNGDDLVDVAVSNTTSGDVGVLLGTGKGSLQPATFSETGGRFAFSMVAGDFNRDGVIDIVTANSGSDTVTLIPGLGLGRFSSPQQLSGVGGAWRVAAFDVNNDGLGDLIVSSTSAETLSVLVNGTQAQALIDISGNLAFGNVQTGLSSSRLLTIRNPGTEPLTVTSLSYPVGFSGMWSGSVPAGGSQVVIVTFAPLTPTVYGGVVVVNANQAAGLNTIGASGRGSATPPIPGDFDNDGYSDLILQHDVIGNPSMDASIGVWFMEAEVRTGARLLSPTSETDPNWKVVGTSDFDRDGQSDLLFRHTVDGRIRIWLMSGSVRLSVQPMTPGVPDLNWRLAGTGDFDNNGVPDVLWQHELTGTLAVWTIQILPDGSFTYLETRLVTPATVSPRWKIRGVADFNRDGYPDLVWQDTVDGWLAVWFMQRLADGTITYTDTRLFTLPRVSDPNWKIVAVGDLNNDLRADLVWQHQTGGWLAVWLTWDNIVLDTRYLSVNRMTDLGWKIVGPK